MEAKKNGRTLVVTGPCVMDGITDPQKLDEAEERLDRVALGIAEIRDIAEPYGIDFWIRAGSFKPRTTWTNGGGEHVFDGLEREGLKIHGRIAEKYGLFPVSELMSERDIPEFMAVKNMVIQIGARNAQNFALLRSVGNLPNNAILKSDTKGYDPKEAEGSLQRLVYGPWGNGKQIVYCVRGQKRPLGVDQASEPVVRRMTDELHQTPHQSADYRNLNNIGVIQDIRGNSFFRDNGIILMFDPSHALGGKTEQTRRDIGRYAIEAVTKFGYDGIMVEVNTNANRTRCDSDQQLPVSLNGIDWSTTQYGKEPRIKPYALNDIVGEIIRHRVNAGVADGGRLDADLRRLREIQYR